MESKAKLSPTASEYFGRDPNPYRPAIAGALYVCSCGNVEDLEGGRRPPECSAECHLPRCCECGRPRWDVDPSERPRRMLQVEPFRSDRLLPRVRGVWAAATFNGDGTGAPERATREGFAIARPYHAHTKITAPPGDFRTGSGDTLGKVFER